MAIDYPVEVTRGPNEQDGGRTAGDHLNNLADDAADQG